MKAIDTEELKDLLYAEGQSISVDRLKVLVIELGEENPGEDTLKLAEWRGRTTMAIEWLVKGQEELKDVVGQLEKRILDAQIKNAGVAATVAILVSIVLFLLSK